MSSRKRVKCFSAWGSFEVREILRGRGEAEEPSLGGASRELACGRYATRRIRRIYESESESLCYPQNPQNSLGRFAQLAVAAMPVNPLASSDVPANLVRA